MLNEEQKEKLLQIARGSISGHFKGSKNDGISVNDPKLNEKMGAFVTLRIGGELRGCIGRMVGDQPLARTVADMAIEAAFSDPRFAPLTREELKAVKIEISVLSPMRKVSSADEIELGRHGVMVRKGFRTGVFLPQVAEETGWSKEEFLSNLCSHKAGLSPIAWKDGSAELHVFSAEVFEEE
ncbi:MAG: AmmeMemoRadiSam system protein A [Candidatus Omnitrophica bacterium]|nr:AmmeMemoRadiSam system protein A [Candidatus Omnitrophota bacterium]